jgi:hypothetical protein
VTLAVAALELDPGGGHGPDRERDRQGGDDQPARATDERPDHECHRRGDRERRHDGPASLGRGPGADQRQRREREDRDHGQQRDQEDSPDPDRAVRVLRGVVDGCSDPRQCDDPQEAPVGAAEQEPGPGREDEDRAHRDRRSGDPARSLHRGRPHAVVRGARDQHGECEIRDQAEPAEEDGDAEPDPEDDRVDGEVVAEATRDPGDHPVVARAQEPRRSARWRQLLGPVRGCLFFVHRGSPFIVVHR